MYTPVLHLTTDQYCTELKTRCIVSESTLYTPKNVYIFGVKIFYTAITPKFETFCTPTLHHYDTKSIIKAAPILHHNDTQKFNQKSTHITPS